ncbi:Hypothetical_protein [Hexamita inflata]|uniref:Hypothetical_protein n=1 Tax=Hexamita inflata TaxID=28002 RepID=A0AA86QNS3_9EUKA|nr:Hypothetical protein HINF_LOCUS46601 [Hexamita inflata]
MNSNTSYITDNVSPLPKVLGNIRSDKQSNGFLNMKVTQSYSIVNEHEVEMNISMNQNYLSNNSTHTKKNYSKKNLNLSNISIQSETQSNLNNKNSQLIQRVSNNSMNFCNNDLLLLGKLHHSKMNLLVLKEKLKYQNECVQTIQENIDIMKVHIAKLTRFVKLNFK